jgi:nucleoside phosphorylase
MRKVVDEEEGGEPENEPPSIAIATTKGIQTEVEEVAKEWFAERPVPKHLYEPLDPFMEEYYKLYTGPESWSGKTAPKLLHYYLGLMCWIDQTMAFLTYLEEMGSADNAKAITRSARSRATGVDVAILFALQEEFNYLMPEIPDQRHLEESASGRAFLLFSYPSKDDAVYHCVTSFVGTMGAQDAGFFTTEILNRYNPKNIVLMGIAGSLDKDVRLGDIVIADEITDYIQDGKVTETEFAPSGRSYRPHIRLVNMLRYLSFTEPAICAEVNGESLADLKRLVTVEDLAKAGDAARNGAAQWHFGHLASGPVVGASSSFASWLRGLDRKFLAIEMEAAGVMNAVCQNAGSERVLVVRGISDMSDERKAQLDRVGSFRGLAMKNSLRLLKALLKAGRFERAEVNAEEPQIAVMPSSAAALSRPLSASENGNAPDTIQPTRERALSSSDPSSKSGSASHTYETQVSSVTKVHGDVQGSITGGVFHGDVKIGS